jgi:hypothetical protein
MGSKHTNAIRKHKNAMKKPKYTNLEKDRFVAELREYARHNPLRPMIEALPISYSTIYKILSTSSRPHPRTIDLVRSYWQSTQPSPRPPSYKPYSARSHRPAPSPCPNGLIPTPTRSWANCAGSNGRRATDHPNRVKSNNPLHPYQTKIRSCVAG